MPYMTDRQAVAALIAARGRTIDRPDADVMFRREQLDMRCQELADERERSDVLHREAFARIEVLTAGLGTMVPNDDLEEDDDESPQDAEDVPGATPPPRVSNASNEAPRGERKTVFGDLWDWLRGR